MVSSQQAMDRGEPPLDAGRSYLGTYGIVGNVWATWLLGLESELLMSPATSFGIQVSSPLCPVYKWGEKRHGMVLRPGEWVCYRHGEDHVERKQIKPAIPKAPKLDVLSRVGLNEMLDYQWDDKECRYVVVAIDLESGASETL